MVIPKCFEVCPPPLCAACSACSSSSCAPIVVSFLVDLTLILNGRHLRKKPETGQAKHGRSRTYQDRAAQEFLALTAPVEPDWLHEIRRLFCGRLSAFSLCFLYSRRRHRMESGSEHGSSTLSVLAHF